MTKLSLDAFEKATEEEMMTVSGGSGFGSAGNGGGWLDSMYNVMNFRMSGSGVCYGSMNTPAQSSGFTTYVYGYPAITQVSAQARLNDSVATNKGNLQAGGCSQIGQTEYKEAGWLIMGVNTYECSKDVGIMGPKGRLGR